MWDFHNSGAYFIIVFIKKHYLTLLSLQGLIESDIKPGESWKNLFKLMLSMGWKLGWELSTVFSIEGYVLQLKRFPGVFFKKIIPFLRAYRNREMMCQSLWAFYRSTPLGNEDSPNFRQLLYCSTVLLIESLFEYISRLEPNTFQSSGQGRN